VRIGEASAAKFALIPRDVTAGEFTKVVQRIPIKILFTDTKDRRLVPGMSVEVGIEKK
jgi:membrane fusion protein (multidrug efflux system)